MRPPTVLAAALLAAAVVGGAAVATDCAPLTVAWSALVAAALPFARRRPRAVAVVVCIAATIAAAQAGGAGARVSERDATVLLCLPPIVVFVLGREVGGVLGAVASVALLAGVLAVALDAEEDSYVPIAMPVVIAWAAGHAVRSRDLIAQQLAERAAELDEERESYAELSVRYERARIAAELHDIVAHAISLMVVQAGAGQRIAASDPAAVAEAFRHIGDAARQAQADMEQLIELLADDQEDGAPPDLELVAELVQRAQGSGLDVALRLEGERGGYPAEVARCAYLVVREGLTNALRYAAGAPVQVVVAGGLDELTVEVRNAAAGRGGPSGLGAGTGLAGLRERLARIGGQLDAGPVAEGGWLLRAELPRRVPAGTPG